MRCVRTWGGVGVDWVALSVPPTPSNCWLLPLWRTAPPPLCPVAVSTATTTVSQSPPPKVHSTTANEWISQPRSPKPQTQKTRLFFFLHWWHADGLCECAIACHPWLVQINCDATSEISFSCKSTYVLYFCLNMVQILEVRLHTASLCSIVTSKKSFNNQWRKYSYIYL